MRFVSDDDLELFIVKSILTIRDDTKMNKFMKVKFIYKLFQFASKTSYLEEKKFKLELAKANACFKENRGIKVYSFNQFNKQASKFEKSIATYLKTIPDMRKKAADDALSAEVANAAYGRVVTPVGIMKMDAVTKKPSALIKKHGDYRELWILDSFNDNQLKFTLAGKVFSRKSVLNSTLEKRFFTGQLIFAPMDNKQTSDLIRRIKKRSEEVGGAWNEQLPGCWPVTPVDSGE
jgi:hypothetical protein